MDNLMIPAALVLVLTNISFAILAIRNGYRAAVAQQECQRMVAQQTRANPLLSAPEAHTAQGG